MPPRKKTTTEVAPQIDKLAWINDQIKQYQEENTLLDQIIAKGPQIKTTATGYPALIFETCSCGTYADRRQGHADSCTVEAVTDPSPIVAAMKEKRLNRAQVADLLSLRDQLAVPKDETAEVASALEYLAQLASDCDQLRAENASLRAQVAAMDGATPAELVLRDAYRAVDGMNHAGG